MTRSNTPTTTPHRKGAALPQGRLSPALRRAIKIRVEQGKTILQSCLDAGFSEAGWHKAMKRPAVRAELEAAELQYIQTVAKRRDHLKARALEVAADIMERGTSEAARMKAVEFIAGESRQALVNVQLSGGSAQFSGYTYERPQTPPEQPSLDRSSSGDDVQDAEIVED